MKKRILALLCILSLGQVLCACQKTVSEVDFSVGTSIEEDISEEIVLEVKGDMEEEVEEIVKDNLINSEVYNEYDANHVRIDGKEYSTEDILKKPTEEEVSYLINPDEVKTVYLTEKDKVMKLNNDETNSSNILYEFEHDGRIIFSSGEMKPGDVVEYNIYESLESLDVEDGKYLVTMSISEKDIKTGEMNIKVRNYFNIILE